MMAKGLTAHYSPDDPNTGHGHVYKRPDGARARCGGPGLCKECQADMAKAMSGFKDLLNMLGTKISEATGKTAEPEATPDITDEDGFHDLRLQQTEPPSDLRQAAGVFWSMYVACRREGFTSEQAMAIVTASVSAKIMSSGFEADGDATS